MDRSIEFWGAIAGILGVLIAILALFRDIFDSKLKWENSKSFLKRLVVNRWFQIIVVAGLTFIFFWSQNNKILGLQSQVVSQQTAFATKETELITAFEATQETVQEQSTQTPTFATVMVTQPPIVVTRIVTQPPIMITQAITQSTITENYEATSSAIVLPTPTPTPTLTPIPSILFSADFEEDPIFELTDSVRLSGGKLTVTVNKGEWLWLPIPDVSIGEDFYFQAQMQKTAGHSCYMGMGLGLGDPFSYHSFLLAGGCGVGTTGFYDNQAAIFKTPNSKGVTGDSTVIGLESKNGLYTLYVNGSPTDTASIDRYGNQVGLVVWKYQGGYPSYVTVTIDNIIVREQK